MEAERVDGDMYGFIEELGLDFWWSDIWTSFEDLKKLDT